MSFRYIYSIKSTNLIPPQHKNHNHPIKNNICYFKNK